MTQLGALGVFSALALVSTLVYAQTASPLAPKKLSGTCPAGQAVYAITDGAIQCRPVIGAVTTGAGITAGGKSGSVALAADTSYLQRRVAGQCISGHALRGIDANGAPICIKTLSAVTTRTAVSTRSTSVTATARCNSGEVAISGGCSADNLGASIVSSYPKAAGEWYCHSYGSNPHAVKAYAVCGRLQ